ncbi:hypothetical protein B0T24DRAFT_341437 [Lasiosphaeria ovina]|uniref:Uncharacterized protein n=1 Tax=Lasiosphaeria ovina TaxID=92902 RepID=A0AAE0K389_9PEZI|nr:hypothetical protein B0T24DRAFT_341437 [Lasiosphaeria ovina]
MPSLLRHLATCLAASSLLVLASALLATSNDFGPSEAAAKQHGFEIFNAVNSALRQWGSSLNHNGLSLFLATVPEGVLVYHGTLTPEPPLGPEWLAFEAEHAENFARPWPRTPGRPPPFGVFYQSMHGTHARLGDNDEKDGRLGSDEESHGYLLIFRVTKPLRLLYVDGMGAGKTDMGTLDTQDLLLRGLREQSPIGELERATDLCDIATEWRLQGVVRMEAGFEIIKCNFSDSSELVSANQRPDFSDSGNAGYPEAQLLEYMRAVSQRYYSIGASRVAVDYSSMVSALFYPVNLTNPDSRRQDLLRLTSVTDSQLYAIKSRVAEVVDKRGDATHTAIIDWQGVTDMIVARYSDRLKYMAGKIDTLSTFQGQVNNLLNLHIEYAIDDGSDLKLALDRCTKYHTASIVPETPEDHLILAGIEAVTSSICSTLFRVRELIVADTDADQASIVAAEEAVQDLVGHLKWVKWKDCSTCAYDEVCFVAMWPFGDTASHERPTCRNSSSIATGFRFGSYWDPRIRPPPPGDDRADNDGRRDL